MTDATTPPIGHNRPPKSYGVHVCPECGEKFTARHHRALFCSPAHKTAYNNRQLAEGQRIVGLAKAWRSGRSTKNPDLRAAAKLAFAQLCRELDALNQGDTAAGRVPALKVYRRREAQGLMDHNGPINGRKAG